MAVSAFGLPNEVIGGMHLLISSFLIFQYLYYLRAYYEYGNSNLVTIFLINSKNKIQCRKDRLKVYPDCLSAIYGMIISNLHEKSHKKLLEIRAKKGNSIQAKFFKGIYIVERGRLTLLPIFPISIFLVSGVWLLV